MSKLKAIVAATAASVAAIAAATLAPPLVYSAGASTTPGTVLGGGDGAVRYRGGSLVSLAVGAEKTTKGYLTGRVAQTNTPDANNKNPQGNHTMGSMHAVVTCLEFVKNQVYVTARVVPNSRLGFWKDQDYTYVEYILTENGATGDKVTAQPLHGPPNKKASALPCANTAQDPYALTAGDIVISTQAAAL